MSNNTPMVELPVEVFNAMTNALRNDMTAKDAALSQARALMAAVEQTAKLKQEVPPVAASAPTRREWGFASDLEDAIAALTEASTDNTLGEETKAQTQALSESLVKLQLAVDSATSELKQSSTASPDQA